MQEGFIGVSWDFIGFYGIVHPCATETMASLGCEQA
jgi:hypothetical protein